MATIDEILKKREEQQQSVSPPKGSQEWAAQNGGDVTIQDVQGIKPEAANEMQPVTRNVGMYKELFPEPKQASAEEIAAEDRKAKRSKLFAAIGDGIAAIANMYYTTQGAPSMVEGNTLSKASQARYDRLKKGREDAKKEYDSWFEGYMRAQRRDEDMTVQLRKMRQAAKEHEEKMEAEAEERTYKRAQDTLNRLRQTAQDNATADYRKKQLEIQEKRASGVAGSGAPKYYGKLGDTEYATRADYEAAVMSRARELGVSTATNVGSKHNPKIVNKSISEIVNKSISEIVAEINAKQNSSPKEQSGNNGRVPNVRGGYQGPQKKKDNPMGSSEKKKKPNPMI